MADGVYYKHSGKFNPIGLIFALGAGGIAAVVVPYVYSYVILYLPIAGYISFAFAVICGGAIGYVLGVAFKAGNVRNTPLTLLTGTAMGGFALYFSWAVWVFATFQGSENEVALATLFRDPNLLWSAIKEINQVGPWTLAGAWTPKGTSLWGLWGIEALLIFGTAALYPLSVVGAPFCENCGRWCEDREDVVRVAAGNPEWLQQQLEHKRLTALEKLGQVPPGAAGWFRLDLQSCSDCGNTNTLSVKTVTVGTDENGEASEDASDFLDNLLLTPDQTQFIRQLHQTLQIAKPSPVR